MYSNRGETVIFIVEYHAESWVTKMLITAGFAYAAEELSVEYLRLVDICSQLSSIFSL